MATVTVVNAERTLEIEATSIVDGEVNTAGHLVLVRHDGTPIDMGAVSSVQVHDGSAYVKADVFEYVGDVDPGAVPNGSIWYDTGGPAGPFSSQTQQGLVELATNAETLAGVDDTRAVTPASLASIPGNKVQILGPNALTETAPWSSYPVGISQMQLTTGSGWSIANGFGTAITSVIDIDRVVQTFYARSGGTTIPAAWVRSSHGADGGGGWTAWHQVMLMINLNPASYTQTTLFTSYPPGYSRLYYTSANSSGWDFNGKYGEVVTYVNGNDFAKQRWTLHTNGGGGNLEVWERTANAGGGWSTWAILAEDTGWVNLSLNAGYTQQRQCSWRRKNGIVYLKGAFTPVTGGYTAALTLPAGARPSTDRNLPVTSNTTTVMSAQITASTGVLSTWTSAATTAWFSIEGISFPVG